MKNLLTRWLASVLALLVITQSQVIPGISAVSWTVAILATLVLGLVNAFIRPIIMFFAWPINCLTFGLMGFIINAFLFFAVGQLVPGFEVKTPIAALIGSLAMGFLSGLFNYFLKDKDEK